MIRPTHSAMARQERKPIKPVNRTGAAQLTVVPGADSVYASAAKGSRSVKMHRRTRCDDYVSLGARMVMLSVRCGVNLDLLKTEAFAIGMAKRAPTASDSDARPTYWGRQL